MIPVNVLQSIKKRISLHHQLYEVKVSASLWEETLHRSFLDANLSSHWNKSGHQSGADVVANNVRFACKSGEIMGKRDPKLSISSHRTTSYKTIEDKLKFLSENHEDVIASLVNTSEQEYSVLLFERPKLHDLPWVETSAGWAATNEDGSSFTITKSMSDQLWMKLNLKTWDNWGISRHDL